MNNHMNNHMNIHNNHISNKKRSSSILEESDSELTRPLTIEIPLHYTLPEIMSSLSPIAVSNVLTLGAAAYENMVANGQKMNHESLYRALKQEAIVEYEPKLNHLTRTLEETKQHLSLVKHKLEQEEQYRLASEQKIREEERRNREDILKEKEARIVSLEHSLKSQLQTIELSMRESSRSLTDGFQSFKQQIMKTASGSKTKGNTGENILSSLLRKAFGAVDSSEEFDITCVGEQGYSGDIRMTWKKSLYMWEAKNYSRNVDKDEIAKFKRDMEMNKEYHVGIFISMETGIVGHTKAGDIDLDTLQDGRPLIYISNFNRQEDAIYYLQGLRPLLEVLSRISKELHILSDDATDQPSTNISEKDKARLHRLEDVSSVLLILIRNHQVAMNKFKNLLAIHKKKNEQMWVELTTEHKEAENQVRLLMDTLVDGTKDGNELTEDITHAKSLSPLSDTDLQIPDYVFKHTNLSLYNERERKFVRDCMDLFIFDSTSAVKSVDVKTALIKKSWTEDSINTMRERVFLEDVWGKGKKEVKYFGIKMDCLE
jgi:hypothetical protein